MVEQFTATQKTRRGLLLLIAGSLGLLLSLALLWQVVKKTFTSSPLTIDDIEKFLGAALPQDAVDIEYYATRDYGMLVRLTFNASPKSVSLFTAHICNGILHQYYNPFDAMNISNAVANAVPVSMQDFTYYSYSPEMRPTYFGNRCWDSQRGLIHILVDNTAVNLFRVTLNSNQACNYVDNGPLPCASWGMFDVRPIPNVPIMVRGLRAERYGYAQQYGNVCLDIDPTVFSDASSPWNGLIGNDIGVFVDSKAFPSAHVTTEGRLTANGNRKADVHVFNYCLDANWEKGWHNITLQIQMVGTQRSYSWKFIAE
jgi:hypothetical protein